MLTLTWFLRVAALLGSLIYKLGLTTVAAPWETARGVLQEPQGTTHPEVCYFDKPSQDGLFFVRQDSGRGECQHLQGEV